MRALVLALSLVVGLVVGGGSARAEDQVLVRLRDTGPAKSAPKGPEPSRAATSKPTKTAKKPARSKTMKRAAQRKASKKSVAKTKRAKKKSSSSGVTRGGESRSDVRPMP